MRDRRNSATAGSSESKSGSDSNFSSLERSRSSSFGEEKTTGIFRRCRAKPEGCLSPISLLVSAALLCHGLRQELTNSSTLNASATWNSLIGDERRHHPCTVEHPFATIKYRIFGHPRLLMRGLTGARAEIGIATMAYNLRRITNVLGAAKLTKELLHAG
jgi:hypothetical protein